MRKQTRGFASMTPGKRKEIARLGGIAAHARGTAHEWNRDEAKAAGTEGGRRSGLRRAGLDPDAAVPSAASGEADPPD